MKTLKHDASNLIFYKLSFNAKTKLDALIEIIFYIITTIRISPICFIKNKNE